MQSPAGAAASHTAQAADGDRYDAIIIGAGMSGLAAGIRLAQYKERVLILDRHYLWGGLNSFYKRRGRLFDVGLHALTNFAPKGRRGVPMTKLLRQLRLRHADLKLGEQSFSEIAFPGERLRFSNEFALFESEVRRAFPHQVDSFRRLTQDVLAYDSFSPSDPDLLARKILATYISDPALIEMLMLPMCYYGSAIPGDIAWYQFVILFKAFFDEGFARPEGGIRPLLDVLVKRFRGLGGELRMKTGAAAILHEAAAPVASATTTSASSGISSSPRRAIGVRLDDGTEVFANQIFSSAGYARTLELADQAAQLKDDDHGQLSFTETMIVTDPEPLAFDGQEGAPGAGATIIFFNDSDVFDYRSPGKDFPLGIDPRSGVICCPNHYATSEEARLDAGIMRYTALADADFWCGFEDEDAYAQAKQEASEVLITSASRFAPDPRPFEIDRDAFTPRTIQKFTGHARGAVYGAKKKHLDGKTPLDDLYIIGTDQGLLGVVGAMLSGISIANRYGLSPT